LWRTFPAQSLIGVNPQNKPFPLLKPTHSSDRTQTEMGRMPVLVQAANLLACLKKCAHYGIQYILNRLNGID